MSCWGREWRSTAMALLMVALLSACSGCEIKTVSNSTTSAGGTSADGDTKTAEKTASASSETIDAEGSSTVYPLCHAFAVKFEKETNHKVSVGYQGTNGGYKQFANRKCDIWNASRPIDPKEKEDLKAKGIEWLELTIAIDGIVIAVNPQNTWCSQLTCAQLKKIWEPDSKVQTWKDLDPSWPNEPMQLYGADTESGTFEYFTEVINGKKRASTTRYTPASNDNVLVTNIAKNKYALGYIPLAYYIENTEGLKAIGVSPTNDDSDSPAPFVMPTEETILSQQYSPLSRPLFMYVSMVSLLGRHEVAEFLTYVVSDEAQPLVRSKGFVRVTDDVRHQMQKKLQEALSSSTAAKN